MLQKLYETLQMTDFVKTNELLKQLVLDITYFI